MAFLPDTAYVPTDFEIWKDFQTIEIEIERVVKLNTTPTNVVKTRFDPHVQQPPNQKDPLLAFFEDGRCSCVNCFGT